MSILAWHFTDGSNLAHGDGRRIRDGRTLRAKGPIELCANGMHASEKLMDALHYAPGSMLWRVELSGDVVRGDDKICASASKALWHLDASAVLRHAARRFALDVMGQWGAPEIVRRWLRTGDKSLRSAAASAARSAARSAATSAARSAATSAAWSAARSAAWSAARSAARSAATSAATSAARSAATSAAMSAATSAARSAAASAAMSSAASAAMSAAWSAARSKQNRRLTAMVCAAAQRRTEHDLAWIAPEVVDALQWCLTELHESHCGCREFHDAVKVLRRAGGEL